MEWGIEMWMMPFPCESMTVLREGPRVLYQVCAGVDFESRGHWDSWQLWLRSFYGHRGMRQCFSVTEGCSVFPRRGSVRVERVPPCLFCCSHRAETSSARLEQLERLVGFRG